MSRGGAVPQASSAAVLPWLRLMAPGEGVTWVTTTTRAATPGLMPLSPSSGTRSQLQ